MEREEVEFLPSGLITCLINGKESKIIKISPWKITLRMAENIDSVYSLKIAFCSFSDFTYDELIIEDFELAGSFSEEFYQVYKIKINDDSYSKKVRRLVNDYWNYVTEKNMEKKASFLLN